MKENEVNKLIIEKIKKSECSDNQKKFLMDILNWEMMHSHEHNPRYNEEFMKRIARYHNG